MKERVTIIRYCRALDILLRRFDTDISQELGFEERAIHVGLSDLGKETGSGSKLDTDLSSLT
jgi:hypothetical protein